MKPKNSPTAERLKATGKPSTRKTTRPPNISGAITSMSIVIGAGRPGGGSLLGAVVFDDDFRGRLHAAQQGDALDEFGEALQGQQREADRQQDLDRPAQQAAGIRAAFLADPAVH